MKIPVEFEEKYKRLLGDESRLFFDCFDNHPQKGLRMNPLKINDMAREKITGDFELSSVPWCSNGYYYNQMYAPGKHPYHLAGAYYIQEPSAMLVGELAPVKGRTRVLDLCAAPGGKTSHLAGKMLGKGLLWSNEYISSRAEILSSNVERMGIKNCIVSSEEPARLADMLGPIFDTVVIDTPCSGEGMFRKDEVAVAEWSPDNVELCSQRSKYILEQGYRLVREGGIICYSTCTFAPEENEKVIYDFLKNHRDCRLIEGNVDLEGITGGRPEWIDEDTGEEALRAQLHKAIRLWPHRVKGEGHFMAIIVKGDECDNNTVITMGKKQVYKISNDFISAMYSFMEEGLSPKWVEEYLKPDRIAAFGDNIYLLPEGCPQLKGIRILRAGLWLGSMIKGRFIPSHSMAMALKTTDVTNHITLELEDALEYLKGNVMRMEGLNKGWYLTEIDGISMGWSKASGGVLKNHYPKGLRIKC